MLNRIRLVVGSNLNLKLAPLGMVALVSTSTLYQSPVYAQMPGESQPYGGDMQPPADYSQPGNYPSQGPQQGYNQPGYQSYPSQAPSGVPGGGFSQGFAPASSYPQQPQQQSYSPAYVQQSYPSPQSYASPQTYPQQAYPQQTYPQQAFQPPGQPFGSASGLQPQSPFGFQPQSSGSQPQSFASQPQLFAPNSVFNQPAALQSPAQPFGSAMSPQAFPQTAGGFFNPAAGAAMQPQAQQSPFGFPQFQNARPANPFDSRAQAVNPNPFGGLTRRDILRYLIGGDTSGGGSNNGKDPRAVGNAQSQLRVALDQASRAENAASRASYGSDRNARRGAASEAQYAAGAARGAADKATSAAANGTSLARDYAAQARAAASRAQGAADRARYNAETGK